MNYLSRIFLVLAALLMLLSGCAGYEELTGRDYPDSARLNYEAGLKYLQSENYETAGKYFALVKTKYTFSKYATISELLIADTKLLRDLYGESVNAYRAFQRDHPSHSCVPYAQYRIGESYMEQINEDWWFMPPSYERDQDVTEKAFKAFRKLVRMEWADDYFYPKDYVPERIAICEGRQYQQMRSMIYLARNNLDFCLDRLVMREVYVAKFYLNNNRPRGSVGRMEGVFKTYPHVKEDMELILLLSESYEKAEMFKKAIAVWEWIAKVYPQSDEAGKSPQKIKDLIMNEGKYYQKRQEREAEIALRTETLRPEMEKQGIQEIDPNPDPNQDEAIPLPDPVTLEK